MALERNAKGEIMDIIVDYKEMNKFKQMYAAINRQIVDDYISDNGSYLPKEDAQTATIVCMLTKSYKVVKNESGAL